MSEFAKAHIRMPMKKREVRTIKISPGLRDAKIVVATNISNERDRIDFFLDYYRQLGVSEFIILDNNSTDGLKDNVIDREGISFFWTGGAYGKARYGIDWMNSIFREHCVNKWVLYVDADEFLVYPDQDTMPLPELVDCLRRNGRRAMSCLMVDIYSENTISENICRPGESPMAVCKYFDRSGYRRELDKRNNVQWTKGGVRGRVFFSGDVMAGPALNKIPLVFWKPWYAYIKSTHEMTPSYLNKVYSDETAITGALMHAKFVSKFADNMQDAQLVENHTAEYKNYQVELDAMKFYREDVSSEFSGWQSLHDLNLIKRFDLS